MKHVDIAIIGGGILGCFAARNMRRWNISTLLMEGADDVCTGITRANTAIVYAGYDNKPGTLKAQMTLRANKSFDVLCRQLDVPFSRCGSLMVSFGPKGHEVLKKKLAWGTQNGVPGLRLLTAEEARQKEPLLGDGIFSALLAPTTGTVNPWQLGIAAYENALENGCEAWLGTSVTGIRRESGGYVVETTGQSVFCKMILNCAGASADAVQEFVYPSPVRLRLDGTDFLVMDRQSPTPKHIIFQESESGKGITAVPCVEGNLLLDSPARPLGVPYSTTREGMDFIRKEAATLLPQVDMGRVIRSFGAVRPNPQREQGQSIHDFSIEQPAADFISLTGIKTPGLTCADQLGQYLAEKAAAYLQASVNADFDPCRHTEARKDHQIICQCEQISRGEILSAIARGATTVEAVKRRVGSGMGRCQGSRCSYQIQKILEECRNEAL